VTFARTVRSRLSLCMRLPELGRSRATADALDSQACSFQQQVVSAGLGPVLALGSWVWGIWGMVLAVPTMVTKVICDHVESLQPVPHLLGDCSDRPMSQSLYAELKRDALVVIATS
jgi:hypothetical protein